jgi:hypothetical protein
MQIAAVAYERLTPAVRAKVDLLIKLNPEYANWVASHPARNAAQYAFVRAAVWADDIKTSALGHAEKGDKPTSPQAGQNMATTTISCTNTGTSKTSVSQAMEHRLKMPIRSTH